MPLLETPKQGATNNEVNLSQAALSKKFISFLRTVARDRDAQAPASDMPAFLAASNGECTGYSTIYSALANLPTTSGRGSTELAWWLEALKLIAQSRPEDDAYLSQPIAKTNLPKDSVNGDGVETIGQLFERILQLLLIHQAGTPLLEQAHCTDQQLFYKRSTLSTMSADEDVMPSPLTFELKAQSQKKQIHDSEIFAGHFGILPLDMIEAYIREGHLENKIFYIDTSIKAASSHRTTLRYNQDTQQLYFYDANDPRGEQPIEHLRDIESHLERYYFSENDKGMVITISSLVPRT